MNFRLPGQLFCFVISIIAGGQSLTAAIPKELGEAEAKYIESATERLSKASDDSDARKKLAVLNSSFLKHLEGMHPKILAASEEGAAAVQLRMQLMKGRLDSSLPLAQLDARSALQKMSGTSTQPAKPDKPPALGHVPTGEMSCREEGKRIQVGESFELKGKTKDIPEGFAVAVFGGKASSGLFPRENRKDPNRRFVVRGQSSETWLGPVEHVLMMVPEAAMIEIEAWYILRRKWESAGFPAGETPRFKGRPTSNLFREDYLKAGSTILAELKMEYVR